MPLFLKRQRDRTLQALAPAEVAVLNAATDIWVRERGPEIDFPGQGQLFYPLLNFPEVDFVTQHPKVLPLVGVRAPVVSPASARAWPLTRAQAGLTLC